jgi:hypothetical protein
VTRLERAILLVLAVVLVGCPVKPTPPVPAPFPACPERARLSQQGSCGTFAEGAPCAECPNVAACYDTLSGVYCVKGSCADPTCAIEPQNVRFQ